MKGAKIGLIIFCFLLSGVIAYFTWGDDEVVPESTGAKTNWKCEKCGHLFELTDSEFYEELKRWEGNQPVTCRKCSEREAWMVALCPTCNEWYYGLGKPESTGTCPNCTKPPVEEEYYVEDAGPEEEKPVILSY